MEFSILFTSHWNFWYNSIKKYLGSVVHFDQLEIKSGAPNFERRSVRKGLVPSRLKRREDAGDKPTRN